MPFDTTWIRSCADELADTVTAHRRAIHRHPEPGFEEHRTAAYVDSVLSRLGVPHRRVVGTGVVAVLEGAGPRCIGIRADMDALPVPEAPGRDGYRSQIDGMSHACGHDAHVAMALGVAELLTRAGELPGTVVLYFQPAEEGPGGGAPMVAAGVLDDPAPQAVLAVHVDSEEPSGVVGVRSGPLTGSTDEFDIVVRGVGGHAAHPNEAIDPIPIAAEIVLSAQRLVSREIDPVTPAVLTFGTIHGGTRHNVIPPAVTLTGTFRTLHEHNRDLLHKRLTELAQGLAAVHRATAEVTVDASYPVGHNDPGLTALVAESARAMLGHERVADVPDPSLGGEDFYAFGATGLPVTMFKLGVGNPSKGIIGAHHSPDFDVDEDALPAGVATFAESIRRFLTG